MRKAAIFICFIFGLCVLGLTSNSCAENADLELVIDTAAETIPLPKVFRPNVDLSGRGFNREMVWPQTVADRRVLESWQKEIGFGGIYRLQYNLWEISQLSKNKDLQNKLINNYEQIIKTISDAGGIVIVNLFGTPVGTGRVLDIRSPPRDLRQYKAKIKEIIRNLSCKNKYNVWYEVWNSADSDEFFIGKWQEYLQVYRFAGQAVKDLEREYKMHIPLGGPSVSWWFQNTEGNTIITPENSLIYELIRWAYHYRMPLDFISWHSYSSDPRTEKATTIYGKTASSLIHNWLTYFRQDNRIPLIVDEWNYDRSSNVLPERDGKSYITASFIPSHIINMYEAGIDYQLYFCLEDFQGNKEGVVRNVGVFSFDSDHSEYKGSPKNIYNVFKMLSSLGLEKYAVKLEDEFAGAIATRTDDGYAIMVYNYIDPDSVDNYLARNICSLNSTGRKILLNFIRSGRMKKILNHEIPVASLGVNKKLRALLSSVVEVNDKAKKYLEASRIMNLSLKNLKEEYLYERYTIDASSKAGLEFKPQEEKEANIASGVFEEKLELTPYSVHLVLLKKKNSNP
jgi:hypothetical protein